MDWILITFHLKSSCSRRFADIPSMMLSPPKLMHPTPPINKQQLSKVQAKKATKPKMQNTVKRLSSNILQKRSAFRMDWILITFHLKSSCSRRFADIPSMMLSPPKLMHPTPPINKQQLSKVQAKKATKPKMQNTVKRLSSNILQKRSAFRMDWILITFHLKSSCSRRFADIPSMMLSPPKLMHPTPPINKQHFPKFQYYCQPTSIAMDSHVFKLLSNEDSCLESLRLMNPHGYKSSLSSTLILMNHHPNEPS